MNAGMNKHIGKPLGGLEHLRQSLVDILSTRIGSRVMRRDYGSDVPNIIDAPVNDDFAVSLYVAVAEAVAKWEPRLKLQQIGFKALGDGKVDLSFEGIYLPDGKPIKMEGLLVS